MDLNIVCILPTSKQEGHATHTTQDASTEKTKVPNARTGCLGMKSRNQVSLGTNWDIIMFTPLIWRLFSSNNVYISYFRAQMRYNTSIFHFFFHCLLGQGTRLELRLEKRLALAFRARLELGLEVKLNSCWHYNVA